MLKNVTNHILIGSNNHLYVVYANDYWKYHNISGLYVPLYVTTGISDKEINRLTCNVNMAKKMSHFVDCFFERCFYSCTVFSRYFVRLSSGCWRSQNFAKYVHLRHPANVLTLCPSEVSWWSMWMHKYNFVVIMLSDIRHWAHDPLYQSPSRRQPT